MATVPFDSSGKEQPSDVRSVQSGGPGLGDLLRGARERRGLTLEQVSKETKISRTDLEELERGNLTSVPVGFYQRARIRAYARVVNLDQDLALTQLDRRPVPPPQAPRHPQTPVAEPRTSLLSRSRVLMIVGVVLAAVVLGRALGGRERPRDGSVEGGSAPQNVGEQRASGAATATGSAFGDASAIAAIRSSRPAEQAAADQAVAEEAATPSRTTPQTTPQMLTPPTPESTQITSAASPAEPPQRRAAPATLAAEQSVPATAQSPAKAAPLPPVPNRPATEVVKAATLPAIAPAPLTEGRPERRAAAVGLVVTSEPAGARVTVNGIAWGLTPVTIRYLPTGDKRIRVSKDGFAAEERVINLAEGGSATVDIRLRSPQ